MADSLQGKSIILRPPNRVVFTVWSVIKQPLSSDNEAVNMLYSILYLNDL